MIRREVFSLLLSNFTHILVKNSNTVLFILGMYDLDSQCKTNVRFWLDLIKSVGATLASQDLAYTWRKRIYLAPLSPPCAWKRELCLNWFMYAQSCQQHHIHIWGMKELFNAQSQILLLFLFIYICFSSKFFCSTCSNPISMLGG